MHKPATEILAYISIADASAANPFSLHIFDDISVTYDIPITLTISFIYS